MVRNSPRRRHGCGCSDVESGERRPLEDFPQGRQRMITARMAPIMGRKSVQHEVAHAADIVECCLTDIEISVIRIAGESAPGLTRYLADHRLGWKYFKMLLLIVGN